MRQLILSTRMAGMAGEVGLAIQSFHSPSKKELAEFLRPLLFRHLNATFTA
jgi:hypothetical protein